MILVSTLRKLIANKAHVYRITVPAQTLTVGNTAIPVSATSRYFASKVGATKALADTRAMGLTNIEVSLIPAAEVPSLNL